MGLRYEDIELLWMYVVLLASVIHSIFLIEIPSPPIHIDQEFQQALRSSLPFSSHCVAAQREVFLEVTRQLNSQLTTRPFLLSTLGFHREVQELCTIR